MPVNLDIKGQLLQENEDYRVRLILVIVSLFILVVPGIIALSIFAKGAKQNPNAPGARELLLLNRFVFWLIVMPVILGLIFIAFSVLGI